MEVSLFITASRIMVLLLIDIDIVKQKLEKPFFLRQWLKLPKCPTARIVKKVLGEVMQSADFMQRPFPEKKRDMTRRQISYRISYQTRFQNKKERYDPQARDSETKERRHWPRIRTANHVRRQLQMKITFKLQQRWLQMKITSYLWCVICFRPLVISPEMEEVIRRIQVAKTLITEECNNYFCWPLRIITTLHYP